jgi:hypothetical protein
MGKLCFANCASLSTVTFESPSHLSSISESAFQSCSSLSSICIPSSGEIISEDFFVRIYRQVHSNQIRAFDRLNMIRFAAVDGYLQSASHLHFRGFYVNIDSSWRSEILAPAVQQVRNQKFQIPLRSPRDSQAQTSEPPLALLGLTS